MNRFSVTTFNPWLIQRGIVKNLNRATTDLKVSEFMELDYMGSAEFEFGAIPSALVN